MKLWSELMKENREVIVEQMVEAFKEAESVISGWHVGVEMDQSGDVWTTGIMNQGSQSQSSWEGKTFIINWVKTWESDYSMDELENAEELKDQFTEYEQLINDANENDEYPEFQSFYEFLDDRYFELYREVSSRITQDNKEFEISEYWEIANEKLDEIIEQQKNYETYQDN